MLAPYIELPALGNAWRQLSLRLRGTFGDETYRQWLSDLQPLAVDGDTLILSAPHNLTAQWMVLQRADQKIIALLQAKSSLTPEEATELWTFRRASGADSSAWTLSAMQQAA